jgi:hypothetical protein
MGLQKRLEFDHSKPSVYDAAGYSLDIVEHELEPRAALLAETIVDEAGMCPTMAVELLMDSSILNDSLLDNRDRAMIVLMAGPVIASVFMQRLMNQQSSISGALCISKYGFDHSSGKEQHEILKISRDEWEKLMGYVKNQLLPVPGGQNLSQLIENMERVLGNQQLNKLQTAVVQAFVARQSATETARRITPSSAVIGPLATIGRP